MSVLCISPLSVTQLHRRWRSRADRLAAPGKQPSWSCAQNRTGYVPANVKEGETGLQRNNVKNFTTSLQTKTTCSRIQQSTFQPRHRNFPKCLTRILCTYCLGILQWNKKQTNEICFKHGSNNTNHEGKVQRNELERCSRCVKKIGWGYLCLAWSGPWLHGGRR